VITECLAQIGALPSEIYAAGIVNQRETAIVWDKNTGKPVYNAIVWQCRRTADYCDELKKRGFDKIIKAKTGLVLDAYFSATKIKWILDNVAGARAKAEKGDLLFGTVDTWLLWNLTKGEVHATDYTNASRTMIYNIHDLKWDKDLLEEFGIPESMLPDVRPSSHKFGRIEPDFLSGEVMVGGIAGDQQSSLFGQCCFGPGMIKNTYGTGCFMLMNTGEKAVESKNGLLTTIAWGVDGKVDYALEGSVFMAGAMIQWLRDSLRMFSEAKMSEVYAKRVKDSLGVYVVPAFVGLGAPYWDQHAKGAIFGLTRGVEKEHFIRAVLESLAYQSYDLANAMAKDANTKISTMKVDGGASANNLLMQFQADLLNVVVQRPEMLETTALGAAYLAGLSIGAYESKEAIAKNVSRLDEFHPSITQTRRKELLDGWTDAVRRTWSTT
jgi:glycerol kinase